MNEIIRRLEHTTKKFPHKELKEAIKRKEEVTPILLDTLDKIIQNSEEVDFDYMLHMYALYLLAQFREKRAFPKIIDLISLDSEYVEELLGDTLTDGLSSIIYSTYDGQISSLKNVIENQSINKYARSAALDVYAQLYSDKTINKEELISYLKNLIYDIDYDEYTDLATDVQGVVVDNHIFEMIDDIQFLYDEDRIDTFMLGKYDDFIDFIYLYKDKINPVGYIDDTIKEMEWWACFEQSNKSKEKLDFKKLEKQIMKDISQKYSMPKKEKISRNDPCPCGSGKKYKNCCINKSSSEKEIYINTGENIEGLLQDYPIEEGVKEESQVLITDIFDEESINIDKLVYLALHYRAIPMWIERNIDEENKNKIIYLTKASEEFLFKCEKEGITSFEEYDKKYKIHYRSKDWFKAFENLIKESNNKAAYKNTLKNIKKIISDFS